MFNRKLGTKIIKKSLSKTRLISEIVWMYKVVCGFCLVTSGTAHCWRNRLQWISIAQSLNKQVNNNKNKSRWAVWRISIQNGYNMFSKISSFWWNVLETCKETRKYHHSQEKQQVIKSVLEETRGWTGPKKMPKQLQ